MFAECNEGIQWFQEEGRWIEVSEDSSIKPSPGMVVFFDWERDEVADHVGIVETCERGMVYTIEGNSGDECRGMYYLMDGSEIMGYGLTITEESI